MTENSGARDPVSDLSRPRRSKRVVTLIVAAAWLYLLPRIVPDTVGDRSIFTAVGDRLLFGDRLYVDVWDNKDPLFYYVAALSRVAPPVTSVLAELAWFAVAAWAMYSLGRWLGISSALTLVLGLAVTPLVLAGAVYDPGMTHIGGAALTLAGLAFAARGRWLRAGAVMGLLFFTKLIDVPMAVLAAVPFVAVASNRLRAVGRSLAGFTVTGVVGAGVLLARGEFLGYVSMIGQNVAYSDNAILLSDASFPRFLTPLRHLVLALGMLPQWTLIVTVTLLVARRLPGLGWAERDRVSVQVAWWCLAGCLLVLGFTGLWPQHGQIVYLPALLALSNWATQLDSVFARVPWRTALIAALCALTLGGIIDMPSGYVRLVKSVPGKVAELAAISPQAQGILSWGPTGTYARVGSNDDLAHARGLNGWRLVCPVFHQYSFQTKATFEPVLDCLPQADVVLVDASAHAVDGRPEWNGFLSQVELLVSGYQCRALATGARVCRRG